MRDSKTASVRANRRKMESSSRKRMLATPEGTPPKGQPAWEGPDLTKHLKASVHSIRRVLPKEEIFPGHGSAVGASARIRRFEPRRLTSCGST
jgi:hypothetical protein